MTIRSARLVCDLRSLACVLIFNRNRELNNFCANIPNKFTDICLFFFSPHDANLRHFFSNLMFILHYYIARWWQTSTLDAASKYLQTLAMRTNYVTRSHSADSSIPEMVKPHYPVENYRNRGARKLPWGRNREGIVKERWRIATRESV